MDQNSSILVRCLRRRAGLAFAALAMSLLLPWWVLSRQTDDTTLSGQSGTIDRIDSNPGGGAPITAGRSSAPLTAAAVQPRVDFQAATVDAIQRRGALSVTIHVALADARLGRVSGRFGDGHSPSDNMHWGALYGVDTHLANKGGWRRVWRDGGDGDEVLQRSVFHRRVEPSEAWRRRGVEKPFDIYVLACAWSSSAIRRAMEQPLREAAGLDTTPLHLDGRELSFGAGGMIVGYLGQNALAREYWDWTAGITGGDGVQRGVFFLCNHSAYFDPELKEIGAVAILLARSSLVCEAYTVEGLLEALARGELDEGFLRHAADRYAKYQKLSAARARDLFFQRL